MDYTLLYLASMKIDFHVSERAFLPHRNKFSLFMQIEVKMEDLIK